MTLSISATVALTCLFVPKVYIVLFQPHKNVRGHGSKGSGPGARPFFGCHQTSALNSLDVTNPSINLHFVQWRAEAVGCPGPTRFFDALENIFYSSRKISDEICLVVHPLFSHQLSNFTRIRSLDAPTSAASCPGNDIFLLLVWSFTYIFLENWPVGCP